MTGMTVPIIPGADPHQPEAAPANEPGGQPAAVPAKWPPWKTALAWVAVVAVLLLCGYGINNKAQDNSVDGYDAQVACKDFVRDRLKAPATAEFSNLRHAGAGTDWTFTGAVDAQNGFGAMLRMNWSCSIRLEGGDTWRLRSLTGLS